MPNAARSSRSKARISRVATSDAAVAAAGRHFARGKARTTRTRRSQRPDWRATLDGFVDRTDRVLALVEGFMPEAEWLDDGETLTYPHSCVSSGASVSACPKRRCTSTLILVDEDLTGGLEPRLGRAHLLMLTIMGFPFSNLARPARSSRPPGSPLSLGDARHLPRQDGHNKLLGKIRRQWFAKRKSIMAILKEVITNQASVLMDSDAANKAIDADAALQELGSDLVGEAMSPRRSRSGIKTHGWPTSGFGWSKR